MSAKEGKVVIEAGPNMSKKAAQTPKKVTKVVEGKVLRKRHKENLVGEAFISETPRNVMDYLIFDVVIPSIKDTFSEVVKRGIDALLFGDGESGRKIKRSGSKSYVAYDRASYIDADERFRRKHGVGERNRRSGTYNNRAGYQFDDIVFPNRNDAERVLDSLVDLTMDYGMAAVSDFFELAGIESNWVDNEYGWYELSRARVDRVRRGYILVLPRPEKLEEDW